MAKGIKDASNLIFKSLRTGLVSLYMDYANSVSIEFSAESVFAKKKGANAIRWDNDRNGTMTVESELFDIGYLAMIMGSDIAEGRSDIMDRTEYVVTGDRSVKIGDGTNVKEDSISVIKLKAKGDTEHVGTPLFNGSQALKKLPKQVKNVAVAANATSARITFDRVKDTTKYLVFRDNNKVAEVTGTTYTDTGLTAETQYTYEIQAVNDFGKGAKSAKVKPTTAASGVEQYTNYYASTVDKKASLTNTGEVNSAETSDVQYTYENGVIKFNENAVDGDVYAIYFNKEVEGVRTLTISADKFADSFEVYGISKMRNALDGVDEMVQLHLYNAKPKSDFTITQSTDEPTSLSIVFDLFPVDGTIGELKMFD